MGRCDPIWPMSLHALIMYNDIASCLIYHVLATIDEIGLHFPLGRHTDLLLHGHDDRKVLQFI